MWDVSDEAIFAGYAASDPEAAAVFVRRFERSVYGLALAVTRDRTVAEDVAQEAFVRAWRHAASFDARRGSVAGWLLGIVRNVAIDRIRGNGRLPLPVGDLPGEAVDTIDVAEVVTTRDDVAHVAALMRSLPAPQREALVAVTLLGLSTREFSEAAAVPHGTVKTRIRLALRRLRTELGVQVE